MKILRTECKMTEEAALAAAEKKGGFVGKLLVRDPLTELRMHYFPFKMVTFPVQHRPLFKPVRNTQVTVACDMTTGAAILCDKPLDLEETEAREDMLEECSIKDDRAFNSAHRLAYRLVRKHVFGRSQLNEHQSQMFYRPYWLAIYGEMVEGNRVRYMPMPADGLSSYRTF